MLLGWEGGGVQGTQSLTFAFCRREERSLWGAQGAGLKSRPQRVLEAQARPHLLQEAPQTTFPASVSCCSYLDGSLHHILWKLSPGLCSLWIRVNLSYLHVPKAQVRHVEGMSKRVRMDEIIIECSLPAWFIFIVALTMMGAQGPRLLDLWYSGSNTA